MKIQTIICLSLKDDTKRRSSFLRAFSPFNIPIKFHDGIDGRQSRPEPPPWIKGLSRHPLYSKRLRKQIPVLNYTLSDQELACVMGHMEIWKTVSDFSHDLPVLVCEDDAEPKNSLSFGSQLQAISDEMRPFELVYLGYSSGLQDTRSWWYLRYAWHFIKRMQFLPSQNRDFQFNRSMLVAPTRRFRGKSLKRAGQHWGAFGYLLTREVAKNLLTLNKDLEMTSDGTMRYAVLSGAIRVSVAHPGLIYVNSEYPSNIRTAEEHAKNFNLDNKFG